jgi:hypothetical protein
MFDHGERRYIASDSWIPETLFDDKRTDVGSKFNVQRFKVGRESLNVEP